MKIHPYAVGSRTERPTFAPPGWSSTAATRSRWELVLASIGGILLGLLGLLAGV